MRVADSLALALLAAGAVAFALAVHAFAALHDLPALYWGAAGVLSLRTATSLSAHPVAP